MFDDDFGPEHRNDGEGFGEVKADTKDVLAIWSAWLDRGWHGVKVADWAGLYLPAKLDADVRFLSLLVDKMPNFGRVAQRMRREAVGDLIRAQHLLPWTSKARPQFFSEQRDGRQLVLKEREHAFPVSQVKSLVLMAMRDGDIEQARKRLLYCWLIPTVFCTRETHKSLPSRCEDFDRPYDRYSNRHDGLEDLKLLRFDGSVLDPDTYSRAHLLEDLQSIHQLQPVVDGLDGLTFPTPEEEAEYTKLMTRRGTGSSVA
ncbi:hypothetical protein [Sphingobium sp. D43FB]|uniref:hypothetical protein n=1 Tax=Sphingobium sp. D43FB TaxID=2017595 RepID=UPI000BD08BF6|nr:hypothetical protein [Sphingobium sp. D43FB]PBN43105.1 hypothetical protein SxD43FB_12515 [Sphingobium sp. D43FB]